MCLIWLKEVYTYSILTYYQVNFTLLLIRSPEYLQEIGLRLFELLIILIGLRNLIISYIDLQFYSLLFLVIQFYVIILSSGN